MMIKGKFKLLSTEIMRFGVIGLLALLTHFCVVLLLVSRLAMPPLIANIIAFLIAFFVSFFGHHYWTFSGVKEQISFAMPRFFMVALMSFLINELLFYLLIIPLKIYYIWALLLVLFIVPPLTFVFSKIWAFAK